MSDTEPDAAERAALGAALAEPPDPLVLPADEYALLTKIAAALGPLADYRVYVDEDGDVQLAGPCAETIGCLFGRSFASDGGVPLGKLIEAAVEHEGEQGAKAHAYLAKIESEWA